MTGMDKIVARLEADAQAEVDEISARSQEECTGILARYRESAESEYAAQRKAGEKNCALRAERLESTAELEARKQQLAFKQKLVGEVFDMAAARIVSLPRADYVAFLAAQAANAAVSGTEELIFNEKDAGEVGQDVAAAANAQLGARGKLTVSAETRRFSGGVIVKQGEIETNCTVEMLIQQRRSDLASQVAELLFS